MDYVWLLKVKRIARRYKTQVDEQTKEMEELKKKTNEAGQSTANGTAEAASSGVTAAANLLASDMKPFMRSVCLSSLILDKM